MNLLIGSISRDNVYNNNIMSSLNENMVPVKLPLPYDRKRRGGEGKRERGEGEGGGDGI